NCGARSNTKQKLGIKDPAFIDVFKCELFCAAKCEIITHMQPNYGYGTILCQALVTYTCIKAILSKTNSGAPCKRTCRRRGADAGNIVFAANQSITQLRLGIKSAKILAITQHKRHDPGITRLFRAEVFPLECRIPCCKSHLAGFTNAIQSF